MNPGENRWILLVTFAVVTASSLPYFIAWAAAPEGTHFTGLLFNPQDANSYIAKMRQGLEGSWQFHLAFTPEQHRGAYIFLFHLSLGHLARWTGLPLIVIYHAARAVGGTVMLLAIYALAAWLSAGGGEPSDRARGERRAMFLLAGLGAGLGWLAAAVGVITSDLWVPEAFPAYALLANAHFPLAMGLMAGTGLCGLRAAERKGEGSRPGSRTWLWGLGMMVAATALGVVQPFGLLAVFGGLGVMLAARGVRERIVPWGPVAWTAGAGVAASLYPLYMEWALRSDPLLSAWNAQNVTSSPPVWDWALSYGLVLVFAVLGCSRAARRGSDADWLLLGWAAVILVGMYLPLPLQRRLSLGLGVPVGLLAGMGWWRVVRPRIRPRRKGLLQGVVVGFSALTPIFLVVMTLLAALTGEPWFYLTEGEWRALEWLRDEGQPNGVVLCAPRMGLFVPAWAGQPVVYGHPFETVRAQEREAQVSAYWRGEMGQEEREEFFEENGVGYVLVGSRERALGAEVEGGRNGVGKLVFEAGNVRVHEVNER